MIVVETHLEDFIYGILVTSVGPILVLRKNRELMAFMQIGNEVILFRTHIPETYNEEVAETINLILNSKYIYLDEKTRIASSDKPPLSASSFIAIMDIKDIRYIGMGKPCRCVSREEEMKPQST